MSSPEVLVLVFLLLATAQAFSVQAPPSSPLPSPSAAASTKKNDKPQRVKPIPYIATTSSKEHGRALAQFIREGDSVLELGTQLDASSETILNGIGSTGSAVLVDVQRTETNSGRTSQGSRNVNKFLAAGRQDIEGDGLIAAENYEYIEIEQFSLWKSILDNHDSPFDVLVLDATAMLGNDLGLTSLSVIAEFVDDMMRKESRPRVVLVKSKAVASLARRLVHAQRLFDGTILRDLTSPSRDGRPYIIAGVGVEEYRRTIPHVVKEGDKIVEVGCFSGTTTALVHESANPQKQGYCIGVDIGPRIIERAKREHPSMKFAVGDGFKSLELMRIKQQCYPEHSSDKMLEGFDVIYADIGGLSGPDGLTDSLSLLDGLGYALEPRCIIIKSLCMRRLASSLRSYSELWEQSKEREAKAS